VSISVLVLVAYYLTAKIGFQFALQPGSVSTLWMPNSILLAGLLLTSARWWWLVIVAALPAHLASELQSGVPTAMVFSWFVSNSVQALIGAVLINSFLNGEVRFDRLSSITVFLVCGAFLGPFLSSFLDSALVKLNGWGQAGYWEIWRVRFLSNVLATLTLVPFVIAWAKGGVTAVKRATAARFIEAGILIGALSAVAVVVFTQQTPLDQTSWRLYWPLPFLVWAAVRFGLRGVSLSLLIIMFLAIIGATRHAGPFVNSSSANNALAIQGFLIIVSVPLIMLAVIIEERGLTEAAARDNEERLTLALNAAQMDTWDWRIADNKLLWSESTKTKFGLESGGSDMTLESFYRVIHPDDRESVENAISKAITENGSYQVEFRMIQNENMRWFLSKGKVFHDTNGRAVRMLGVGIDITDRKHAEQALAEINERNQAILRAIPDAMFLQDKNGIYLEYYTQQPEHLLVPPSEFLGKRASDVLPKDLGEKVHQLIDRLGDSDEPQVLEYTLHVGNEDRHFEARVVNAEGDHALSIVRDITDARRAAEAVRETERRLLQSSREIRSLAAQLITAQESERRRISILLHDDISQSVASMGLAISRLKRKLPTSNAEITLELDRLGTQVQDLTSQIRQLSHQLHPEILEHVGLVKALRSHVAEFSSDHKMPVKFSADVETFAIPPEVAACLYRVALEALRNVLKHSGAGSAVVAIKEQDGFLELTVSDSGHGFDVDKVRHGSGLGLVSSEERIRLLQGTFEITSNMQTGTCLVARIPLLRAS
jgi:PAS domain S-box-containing protein